MGGLCCAICCLLYSSAAISLGGGQRRRKLDGLYGRKWKVGHHEVDIIYEFFKDSNGDSMVTVGLVCDGVHTENREFPVRLLSDEDYEVLFDDEYDEFMQEIRAKCAFLEVTDGDFIQIHPERFDTISVFVGGQRLPLQTASMETYMHSVAPH
ncbi:hypothetical protein FOZ61_008395 [Perkinsus olseni]|uniref:Uncharacterized protein n=1 Tax=Perkinsus olseni TaxID=32597 RepID=A0A7J6LCI2_PEROL|nr:hypothetical protein FOZ61_008395 [Perkinsus olseni]KAF4656958.1 hypothetical protein FOL46_007608 [Perkinsus olseni]